MTSDFSDYLKGYTCPQCPHSLTRYERAQTKAALRGLPQPASEHDYHVAERAIAERERQIEESMVLQALAEAEARALERVRLLREGR